MQQAFPKLIQQAKTWGAKKGKSLYLKFLSGIYLTHAQAIAAYCYSCTCGTSSTCTVAHCPLYPNSPYSPNQKNVSTDDSGD